MPATESLPRPTITSVSSEPQTPEPPTQRRRRRLLAVALVAVVAAAVAAVLLLTGGEPDRLEIGEPRIVSEAQLASYAESAGHPVYWAGSAADGYKLELTEVRGQRVFVRYLADSAKAGDPRADFTTVATYPMQGAYEQLRASADRSGSVEGETDGGALTLYYKKAPSNVYVAHPGSDQLVEVFAPEPRAAQQLAESPLIAPVE
jgi:hypothetical protein